jgi:hypothetical protein
VTEQSEQSVVTLVLAELYDILTPLRQITIADDPALELRRFLGGSGWRVARGVDVTALVEAVEAIETTVLSAWGSPVPVDLASVVALLDDVAVIVDTVLDVASIVSGLDASSVPSADELAALAEDIGHHLAVSWLKRRGAVFDVLRLVGAIDVVDVTAVDLGWLRRSEGSLPRVKLDRLPSVVSDPVGAVLGQLAPSGWATTEDAAFTNITLSRVIGPLLGRLGGAYRLNPTLLKTGTDVDAVSRQAATSLVLPAAAGLGHAAIGADLRFVSAEDETSAGEAGPALEVRPWGNVGGSFAIGDVLVDLVVGVLLAGSEPASSPAVVITPAGVSAEGEVALTAEVGATLPAGLQLGTASTGLVIGNLTLRASASSAGPDFGFAIGVTDAALRVSTADLGEAIDSVVSFDAEVPFELELAWSNTDGLRLTGNASLEILLVEQLSIAGVVEVTDVRLALTLDEGVRAALTAGVSFELGPVAAAAEGLGFAVTVVPQAGGNLGAAQLGLELVPPTGAGLSLDLSVVAGGGYVNIDHDAGVYEGLLDLDVLSIGITAVAIIETKNPDVDGWSVFFALFLDLPAIQLGFGFALTGVGGLAGINRTIDAAALEQAVRSGSLDTILFPEDPVANAPAIIDAFSAIFPAADGRYVFGPVVKISWGTPTIVDAKLGIVIELPDPVRLAILGSVSAVLPSPESEIVAFRLDVAGLIDFGAGTISLDASLHDSHVLSFAISGDMALRANVGGQPSFLMALGGFHPGFTPPSGFPALDRLSMGLSSGGALEMRFECYFALTSNTVQFGASFSFAAEIAGFGIEGGTEFDALIQFSPFRLQTHLGMHVSITAAGVDLAGVWLDADLDGPNPWHVVGTAEFKILGISESIRVDERLGTAQDDPAVTTPDVLGDLAAALDTDDAWELSSSTSRGVQLSVDADADAVTPDGTVSVRQRLVPLDTAIERFGEATELEHVELSLVVGEGLTASGEVSDWFAPDQFFDLTQAEQLAAPSFEQRTAGLSFGGGLAAGPARTATRTHESSMLDPELSDDGPAPSTAFPLGYVAAVDGRRGSIEAGVTGIAVPAGPRQGSYAVTGAQFTAVDPLTGEAVAEAASFTAAVRAARDNGALLVRVGSS